MTIVLPDIPACMNACKYFRRKIRCHRRGRSSRQRNLAVTVLAVGVRDLFLRGRVLGSRGLAWLLPVACDLVNGD